MDYITLCNNIIIKRLESRLLNILNWHVGNHMSDKGEDKDLQKLID